MTSRVVKVPEGCLQRASNLQIRNEVLIYYKLKTVNIQGYFRNGAGIKQIIKHLGADDRTIRRWFRSLHSLGLLYKDDNGYGLVKYDKLYQILGYDLTENNKTRRTRAGSFKIFKVPTSSVSKLIIAVAKEEIALNIARQDKRIERKLTQTDKPDQQFVSANTTTTLSCSSVSKLLGYRSASSGSRIEKQLVISYPNTVKIDKHVEVISVDSPFAVNNSKLGKRFYKENGIVFKVLCNRIYIH